MPLPTAGATLVALSEGRAAVALPGPPRLLLLDAAGVQVGLIPLAVPDADLAADATAPTAAIGTTQGTTNGTDGQDDRVYWWTGSRTIALNSDLTPLWTVEGTLGPAQPYGGGLLVPAPAGLLVLDAGSGAVLRTIPVSRADRAAPVRLSTAGEMLIEQRGTEVVALRPTG